MLTVLADCPSTIRSTNTPATACLQEPSSLNTWKIKALSVTKGKNTEERLCGVLAIMLAILSAEKNPQCLVLGIAKMTS